MVGHRAVGYLNDLWKYDPTLNIWSYINGNKTINGLSIYTENGIPGGRRASTLSRISNNSLILFGGFGYATTSTAGCLSDLWIYNLSNNIWSLR